MARNRYQLLENAPVDIDNRAVDDLVVTCSDHRFQNKFEDVLYDAGIGRADKLAYPGASVAIADGTLLPAIQKLEDLHGFSGVHILDHTDCGAFGGLEAFDGDEGLEAEAHFRKLEAAQTVIHEVLPHITVVTYLVNAEGDYYASDGQVGNRQLAGDRTV